LKGSCVNGISYLGALAWMATDGCIAADFQRVWREAPDFYRQAVEAFRRALVEGANAS
jgi:hypothetical protein